MFIVWWFTLFLSKYYRNIGVLEFSQVQSGQKRAAYSTNCRRGK